MTLQNVTIVHNGAVESCNGSYLFPQSEAPFFSELCRLFARVTILGDVALRSNSDGFWDSATERRITVVPLCARERGWGARQWRSVTSLTQQLAEARRRRDCIYVYYPGRNAIVAASLLRRAEYPYGLYVRGAYALGGAFGYFHKRNIRAAAGCLVTGGHLLRRVRAANPRARMVAPMLNVNAGDLDSTRPPRDSSATRLLFVGELSRAKGAELFVDVVEAVSSRGGAYQGRIIGTGTPAMLARLEQRIKRSPYRDCIQVVGVKTSAQVRDEMVNADILLLPTRYNEGFPRVIYEALTLGTLVITSRRKLFAWLLEDGRNCLLCPPGKVRSYAAAIENLARNQALADSLRAAGRRSMSEVFQTVGATSHGRQLAELFSC